MKSSDTHRNHVTFDAYLLTAALAAVESLSQAALLATGFTPLFEADLPRLRRYNRALVRAWKAQTLVNQTVDALCAPPQN